MASRGVKICLAVPLLFLIIVTAAIVTLFLTIFKPRDPVISVHPVGLKHFQLPLLYNPTTKMSLRMVITTENPNYGSFEHTNSIGYVKFHETIVGEVPIRGELVPARSQINVSTSADLMLGKLMHAPQFWSDLVLGTLNLTSKVTLPGEARMLNIIKLRATAYSLCDISFNLRSKDAHSKCISKLKLEL